VLYHHSLSTLYQNILLRRPKNTILDWKWMGGIKLCSVWWFWRGGPLAGNQWMWYSCTRELETWPVQLAMLLKICWSLAVKDDATFCQLVSCTYVLLCIKICRRKLQSVQSFHMCWDAYTSIHMLTDVAPNAYTWWIPAPMNHIMDRTNIHLHCLLHKVIQHLTSNKHSDSAVQ
jgi:hypothetical protein